MSGYTVQEPEEIKYFVDGDIETIEYWSLYSPIQKKRFKKVLNQMRETWFDVYKQIKFIRDNISLYDSNALMLKVHKMFITEHRYKTEYYNDEKIFIRRKNNYISKKLSKLRSMKNKI
jgi:hypothetical protein